MAFRNLFFAAFALAALSLGGCGTVGGGGFGEIARQAAPVVGGVAGGVGCSQFGSGSGKTLATIGCTLLGAAAGQRVADKLTPQQQAEFYDPTRCSPVNIGTGGGSTTAYACREVTGGVVILPGGQTVTNLNNRGRSQPSIFSRSTIDLGGDCEWRKGSFNCKSANGRILRLPGLSGR